MAAITEAKDFQLFPLKFDTVKANKYQDKIHSALDRSQLALGPFKTMVKSGEVFQVPSSNVDYPYCYDDSRPRNIMTPQGLGFSIRAAVQENLWHIVEEAFPEFVHGLTST